MAQQVVSDLIMMFVGDDGQPIDGEASTEVDPNDQLASDFEPGKMIEVESFTVKTGISSRGDSSDITELGDALKDSNKAHNALTDLLKSGPDGDRFKKLLALKGKAGEEFQEFRAGENARYPVDLKPVEFSRPIDTASPTLLTYCIKRRLFKKVSLIKRKAAGGPASGQVFLRMDFTTVLIKSIDWDNDEPPKETCEFVCRAVDIQYLPQLPDGSLGAAVPASWKATTGQP